MATYYVRGPRGSVAHPVTGESFECGPDSYTLAGDDSIPPEDWTNPATPAASLDQSFLQGLLSVGDEVVCGGRIRASVSSTYALQLFDLNGVTVRQNPDWEVFQLRGDIIPGGVGAAGLTNNKTVGAGYWVAATNAYTMTCNGADPGSGTALADLSTGIAGIAGVFYDYDRSAFVESSNSEILSGRKSALVPPAVGGITVRGAWLANQTGLNGAKYYLLGDTVSNAGTTYICITANDSGATFLGDIAKWETFATEKIAVTTGTVTADGAWCFDFQTGELVVRLPTAMTPANATANGVDVVLKGRTGISFTASGGSVTVEDCCVRGESSARKMRVSRWGGATDVAPFGTGTSAFFSDGVCFQDIIYEYPGDHAWAFGNKVLNPLVTRCDLVGFQAGCYVGVFNASGVGNVASGCVNEDFTWRPHSYLTHSGALADRATASIGGYTHGPHTAAGAIIHRNGTVIHYTTPALPDNFSPFDTQDGTAPSDLTRAALRPVRIINCTQTGGVQWANQSITGHYVGYERCSFSFTAMNKVSNGHGIDRSSVTGDAIFEGCELIGNLINGNGQPDNSLIAVGANFKVRLLNTTCYDMAGSHAAGKNYGIFFASLNGAAVTMSGSRVGFRDQTEDVRVIIGDNSATTTYAINKNSYWNIKADKWSENLTYAAKADWITLIDTGTHDDGVAASATSPFTSAAGADTSLTAAARAFHLIVTPHVTLGVNDQFYGGQPGGWQYGSGGGGGRLTRGGSRVWRVARV